MTSGHAHHTHGDIAPATGPILDLLGAAAVEPLRTMKLYGKPKVAILTTLTIGIYMLLRVLSQRSAGAVAPGYGTEDRWGASVATCCSTF